MLRMSTLFQSNGLSDRCSMTPSGCTDCSSKLRDTSVTGWRQHAQCDSSRTVLSLNGGMFENATASLAQPAKLWNSSSTYARTWLGKLEKGGALMRLQFCESSSTTTTMPSCNCLYAWMICWRDSPSASCASRNVGPRPCSHQNANTCSRRRNASSVNSNGGTFCGISSPVGAARLRARRGDYARAEMCESNTTWSPASVTQ